MDDGVETVTVHLGSREKVELEVLESHKSVKEWMRQVYTKRSRSLYTKYGYLRLLNKFCKFIGLGPDGLVENYQKDDGVYVESRLDEYLTQLIDRSLLVTARNVHVTLRSFFKHQKPRIELKTEAPRPDSSLLDRYKTQPTEEHFRKLIENARSLRDKFLLAFLRQTGVRVGWASEMRLKHIRDLEFKDDEPILKAVPSAIDVYPDSKEHYVTFLAKDGCDLLFEYLKSRAKGRKVWRRDPVGDGKFRLSSEWIKEELGPESYLFIKERDKPRRTWTHQLEDYEIQWTIKTICQRVGVPSYSPHSFRRMFMNSLERAGIHSNRIEALMGHLHGIKAVYSAVGRGASLEQKIEELRADYVRSQPELSLDKRAVSPRDEFLGFVRARAKALGISLEDLKNLPQWKVDLKPEEEYLLLEDMIMRKYLMKEKIIEEWVTKEEKELEKGEKSEKKAEEKVDCRYELVDEAKLMSLLNAGIIGEGDILKEVNGKTLVKVRDDGEAETN